MLGQNIGVVVDLPAGQERVRQAVNAVLIGAGVFTGFLQGKAVFVLVPYIGQVHQLTCGSKVARLLVGLKLEQVRWVSARHPGADDREKFLVADRPVVNGDTVVFAVPGVNQSLDPRGFPSGCKLSPQIDGDRCLGSSFLTLPGFWGDFSSGFRSGFFWR